MRLVHAPVGKQRAEDQIREAHDAEDTVLVSWGAVCQLGNELGGPGAAMEWLRDLVAGSGRPLAFSAPSCDSACEAHVLTPPGWSEGRALGWVGGLHEDVEAMFGSANVFHERGDGSRVRLR
jgi:hypothetical protein